MAYDRDHTWGEIQGRVSSHCQSMLLWMGEVRELFEDLRVYKAKIGTNAQIATHLDAKEAVTGTVTTEHIDDLESAVTSMKDLANIADGTSVTITAFADDLRRFVP